MNSSAVLSSLYPVVEIKNASGPVAHASPGVVLQSGLVVKAGKHGGLPTRHTWEASRSPVFITLTLVSADELLSFLTLASLLYQAAETIEQCE